MLCFEKKIDLNNPGIYEIVNIINGKSYIGSTVCLHKRYIHHKAMLLTNKHGCQYLQNSFNYHHQNNFIFVIREICKNISEEDLRKKEQDILTNEIFTLLHPEYSYYNMAKDVTCSMMGRKHSQQTKDKISKSHMGIKNSPVARQKISQSKLGKTMTIEARQNMSKSRLGRNNGRYISDIKAVNMLTGQEIVTSTVLEMANSLNVSAPTIIARIKKTNNKLIRKIWSVTRIENE